jgi:hypothetical protein
MAESKRGAFVASAVAIALAAVALFAARIWWRSAEESLAIVARAIATPLHAGERVPGSGPVFSGTARDDILDACSDFDPRRLHESAHALAVQARPLVEFRKDVLSAAKASQNARVDNVLDAVFQLGSLVTKIKPARKFMRAATTGEGGFV